MKPRFDVDRAVDAVIDVLERALVEPRQRLAELERQLRDLHAQSADRDREIQQLRALRAGEPASPPAVH
jgi:uncharacterized protein YigA (DUF484 family)